MRKRKIILITIFLVWCILCTACGEKDAEKKQEDMKQYPLTSQLEIPSKKELENIYPESYNKKMIKRKGLSETKDFSEKYLYMQALYRANLEAYLMETLDLQEVDNTLENGELYYLPIEETEKDLYARYSTMNLNYIYLRNNLCIERLEKEDLATIEKALKEGKEVITEEMKALAARTYPTVISAMDESKRDAKKMNVPYLRASPLPSVPNNALVLVIGTSFPYDEKGMYLPHFPVKKYDQILDAIKEEKEESYEDILNIPVYIWVETGAIELSDEEVEELYQIL